MTTAALYTPSGTAAQVDGDWYDAICDGQPATLVADVDAADDVALLAVQLPD